FDARTKWAECISIRTIRDQSACGSCWAVSAASAMSDRLCILSGGKINKFVSDTDILACCGSSCGDGNSRMCNLLLIFFAFKPRFFVIFAFTLTIQSLESNSVYNVRGVENIQREIMTNGPVQATFTVYEDFYTYKSGVYVHTAGGPAGGHAIKIIGWGVEKSTPYWLISNSWSSDWGDNGKLTEFFHRQI
ncbi:papain family cysteine protease, partial [Oesophagostomum dentatum]